MSHRRNRCNILVVVSALSFHWACRGGEVGLSTQSAALAREGDEASGLIAIAELTGSLPEGEAPLVEYLDGTRSHSLLPGRWIASFHWDFGDGSPPSSHGWVEHLYASPGDYVARLTVTDNEGAQAQAALPIRVLVPKPRIGPLAVIAFTGSVPYGSAPLAQYFDATHSVARDPRTWISTFRWNFGDGTPEPEAAWIAHTYDEPGSYPVTLWATDNHLLTSLASTSVDVFCAERGGCGRTRWAARWGEAGRERALPQGSGLDGDGNGVFLVQREAAGQVETFVRKLSRNGETVWERSLGSAMPSALAVAPFGDVWLALESGLPEGGGRGLLSVSPQGQVKSQIPSPRAIRALAVDGEGAVYAAGEGFIDKRQPDGAIAFAQEVAWDLWALVLDADGQLVVGGNDGAEPRSAWLATLAPDGTLLRSFSLGQAAPGSTRASHSVRALKAGPTGLVAAAGRFDGQLQWSTLSVPSGQGSFVLTTNTLGAQGWARVLPFEGQGSPPLAVSGDQSVTVAGRAAGLGPAAFTYTARGQAHWMRAYPAPAAFEFAGLEADSNGLWISGSFEGEVDFGEGPLASMGQDAFFTRLFPESLSQ